MLEGCSVESVNDAIDSLVRDVEQMQSALRLACEEITDVSGTCPFDANELFYRKWEQRCEERCSSDVDMAACWMDYFMERSEG